MARATTRQFFQGLGQTPLARFAMVAVLLSVGTGCQTVDSSTGAIQRLQRASAALEQPSLNDRQTAAALRRYRRAVAGVLPDRWPVYGDRSEQAKLTLPGRGWLNIWQWIGSPRRTDNLHRDGVGLPLVERIVPGGANSPRGGYNLPRTALAWVDPADATRAEVELVDPERVNNVTFGGRRMPLAMDLEAPLNAAKGLGPRPLDGLFYLLRVNRFTHARLVFLQPYDPAKVPVVLVHGLLSTPRMWSPVVRALMANEKIRTRYQFWFFYYPTGQPIPLSAMQLREELDDAIQAHHVRQPLVLIGHSMGGILARAQIVGITPAEADQIMPGVAALPAGNRVRQALVFKPRTDIDRAVFIATPHRGSMLALHGLAGIGIRLIRLPLWIQTELAALADLPFGDRTRRFPTSICGLSPNSQFLQALDRSPSSVPMHSIIAQRGRGDLERSSDGVVPYQSAHLPDAVSEVIVPAGHGGFSHPLAIQEIERILLEDGSASHPRPAHTP